MLGFYFKILSTVSLAISLSSYMLIASVMFGGGGWSPFSQIYVTPTHQNTRVRWSVHSFLPYVFFLILEKSDND